MWSLRKMIGFIIIMNHRSKVLYPGEALMLWWVSMRGWCLLSIVVVSSGCLLLRFASKLRLWALGPTLSWRGTWMKNCHIRHLMWRERIPGLFCLTCRQRSALWCCLLMWMIPWMLVLGTVMRRECHYTGRGSREWGA